MNFALHDSIAGRQRCRQWSPLVTQQLRVRHLYQVIAYNVSNNVFPMEGFYYTLHTTSMCAPFYTSETITSPNPKWAEIEFSSELTNTSSTAFVLRIWQESKILLTWGVNLSGLVYLGSKLSDIQPESFRDNTVIFYLRGGFFTSLTQLRTDLGKPLPFTEYLNVVTTESSTKPFRSTGMKFPRNDIRSTYSIDKLRKLHSLQIKIKNSESDVEITKDRIGMKNGTNEGKIEVVSTKVNLDSGNIRYAPQLLTMTSLNKMLQEKPTKVQRQEIVRIKREIENSKLKTKILLQERDRKQGQLRLLKNRYSNLCDDNEERNSQLMEDYRSMSKEIERLREYKKHHVQQKEVLHQLTRKLHNRRRQLMSELLFLYPIEQNADNKYVINGRYLPSSDMLIECSDRELSVALGYVTHVLIMCASFLHVPLRYPLQHIGSRSVVEDHISASLTDKSREFPLYTRGKDRMQFNYAVYLLNKNIAQYLYLLGAKSPDLKATLPNLLSLLQGKEYKNDSVFRDSRLSDIASQTDTTSIYSHDKIDPDVPSTDFCKLTFGSSNNVSDPILDCIRQEYQIDRSRSPTRSARRSRNRTSEQGPGLSQILAIPEAFMNHQMSSSTFKSYMHTNVALLEQANVEPLIAVKNSPEEAIKNCDKKDDSIEEGTEIMAPIRGKPVDIIKNGVGSNTKQKNRLSRSVGSYTDDEKFLELHNSLELGSDPLLNTSSDANNSRIDDLTSDTAATTQQEFLQKWLDSGPALICSEENLYPDEYLGGTAHGSNSDDNPLTLRTDALLKTKSFNLVKPKF